MALEIHEPRCDGQRSHAKPTQVLPMCWKCQRRLDVQYGVHYSWFSEPPAVPPHGPDDRWICAYRVSTEAIPS